MFLRMVVALTMFPTVSGFIHEQGYPQGFVLPGSSDLFALTTISRTFHTHTSQQLCITNY